MNHSQLPHVRTSRLLPSVRWGLPLVFALAAASAGAQELAGSEEDAASGDAAAEEGADPAADGAAPAATAGLTEEQLKDAKAAEEASSPVEDPTKTYYFLGARYRGLVVPQFMINMFADGGDTVWVNSFGPEFGIRKAGFETIFSFWYADYGMDATLFKGKSEPDTAYEFVTSTMKLYYFTGDFLWSSQVAEQWSINYGMGAGFALTSGAITRTEATWGGSGYVPCTGPNNPANEYCESDGHYNYNEPAWTNGGSKPSVFPWLAIQTGVRFKPHRNFASRLDLGFSTSGFMIGFGADYGL